MGQRQLKDPQALVPLRHWLGVENSIEDTGVFEITGTVLGPRVIRESYYWGTIFGLLSKIPNGFRGFWVSGRRFAM